MGERDGERAGEGEIDRRGFGSMEGGVEGGLAIISAAAQR